MKNVALMSSSVVSCPLIGFPLEFIMERNHQLHNVLFTQNSALMKLGALGNFRICSTGELLELDQKEVVVRSFGFYCEHSSDDRELYDAAVECFGAKLPEGHTLRGITTWIMTDGHCRYYVFGLSTGGKIDLPDLPTNIQRRMERALEFAKRNNLTDEQTNELVRVIRGPL